MKKASMYAMSNKQSILCKMYQVPRKYIFILNGTWIKQDYAMAVERTGFPMNACGVNKSKA